MTTSSTEFHPIMKKDSVVRAYERFVAVRMTNEHKVMELTFGYFDKNKNLKCAEPIFRTPPSVHFDIHSAGFGAIAPVVHNISPTGCRIYIAGTQMGTSSPRCSILVSGEKVLISKKEKIIFCTFYFISYVLGLFSLAYYLRDYLNDNLKIYQYLTIVIASILFTYLDFQHRQKITGQFPQNN